MSRSGRAAWAPTRRLLVILAATALAAGCGGGGGDGGSDNSTDSAALSAEGFYLGTMGGGTSNYFEQIILENNEVWLTYGTQASAGATTLITGMMTGTGTYSGGTFAVAAMKDFGVAPAATGTFTATYKINSKSLVKSVSGTATVGAKNHSFTGNNSVSNYFYSDAATLSAISGNWALPSATGPAGTLSVGSTGGFSVSVGGCGASGTMVPRPSGKNVFNVTLTFGAAPCSFAGATFTGIAFVATNPFLNGGNGKDLRVLIRNGAQTAGLLLAGNR